MNTRDKIGARKPIANKYQQFFPRGSLLFTEGESGREMYILKSGKVRILKQEGENTVELATIGAGSVLGEMSLLDGQPRSATAQIIEDVSATVIDEHLLERTLQKVPTWLSNIVRVVIQRLRSTMKKTSDDVVRKSVGGVIRVLLLLAQKNGKLSDGMKSIGLQKAKETIYAVIGLSGMEAENVLLHLILKEMIYIRKQPTGEEIICFRNPDALELYMNYLRTKQRGASIQGEALSKEAAELIPFILVAGERNGKKIPGGLVRVGLPQVEIEYERKGLGRIPNLDIVDELHTQKIVAVQEDRTESKHGRHNRMLLLYNEETLRHLLLLKQWQHIFEEDVQF